MPNELEILIKTTADQMGITLTTRGLEKITKGLEEAGRKGGRSFEGIGSASSRMSFRTGQQMEHVALSVLGIHSPLSGVLNRVQSIQFAADRMGLSVMEMISRFGAGIAGVAGVSIIANEAIKLSKEADAAWEAAGFKAKGFFDNLAIGFGIKEIPKISGTFDFKALGLLEIESAMNRIKKLADALTHEETPAEKVQAIYRPLFSKIAERTAALQPGADQIQRLSDLISESEQGGAVGGLEFARKAYKEATGEEANIPETMPFEEATNKLLEPAKKKLAELRKLNNDAYKAIAADKKTLEVNAADDIKEAVGKKEAAKLRDERETEHQKLVAERVARGEPASGNIFESGMYSPVRATETAEERRQRRLASVASGSREEDALNRQFASEKSAADKAAANPKLALQIERLVTVLTSEGLTIKTMPTSAVGD